MNRIGRARIAGPIVIAIAALAGCGSNPAPTGVSSPATPPASHSPTAPTSPAPTPTPTPAPTAPALTVVSSRVAYDWHWPNDVNKPGRVEHAYPVPAVPQLVAIRVGDHPADAGRRAYSRMSFTFTNAFPSYHFGFTGGLTADPSGKPVKLLGDDVLTVRFHQAQAHTASGASSVAALPPAALGLAGMAGWAQAGDFEGTLTFGIGKHRPIPESNPQYLVRAVEVEAVTAQGQHQYVVAIDLEPTPAAPQIVSVQVTSGQRIENGWLMLPDGVGTATIGVAATGASYVEVYLTPTGTGTAPLARLIGTADVVNGRSTLAWHYPDQQMLDHLSVVAHGPGGKVEDFPFNVYHP